MVLSSRQLLAAILLLAVVGCRGTPAAPTSVPADVSPMPAAEETPTVEATAPAEASPTPAAEETPTAEATIPAEASPTPAADETSTEEATAPADASPTPATDETAIAEATAPADAIPTPAAEGTPIVEGTAPAETSPTPAAEGTPPVEATAPADTDPTVAAEETPAAGSITAVVTQEQAAEIADNALQAYNAGDYAAWARDWSRAMKAQYPESDFLGFREQLMSTHGRYVRCDGGTLVQAAREDRIRWVFACEFEKGQQEFKFTFAKEGKRVLRLDPRPRPRGQ